MKRNPAELVAQTFDVIVIGAGIYGATLTLQLAEAGLRTLVIDQGDFCSATSANSLKILHGGLRYLQHGNIRRMRETIFSRRSLMRCAPHLTQPLACLIPTYGHGLRSRAVMRIASVLNNLISADRNLGLPPSHHLPGGRTVGPAALAAALPGLPVRGSSGGAIWYDALAVQSERLVLEHLLAAREQGASFCNYLRADTITVRDNRVTGIRASDLLDDRSFDFSAPCVVNAAGPWFDDLLTRSGIHAPPTSWAKAVNLVVNKPLNERYALGIEGQAGYRDQDALVKRDKRFFFFVPWRGGTMIGTTYQGWQGTKDDLRCDRADIEAILAEVHTMHPGWGLTWEDVSFCHCGLLPMAAGTDGHADTVQLAKHSLIIDHGRKNGPEGLISLRSIKYTTAPAEAAKVTRIITSHLPRRKPQLSPRPAAVPACSPEIAALLPMLSRRYGRWAERVLAYVADEDGQDWWLSRQPELLRGEIRYFIREEMAVTLADVLLRRTGLGTFRRPAADLVTRLGECMATELGWDAARREEEIRRVERLYAPLTPVQEQP